MELTIFRPCGVGGKYWAAATLASERASQLVRVMVARNEVGKVREDPRKDPWRGGAALNKELRWSG